MKIHFILHVSFETPGTLIDWCREKGHSFTITNMYEFVEFPHTDEIDMLVIMGGPMSVHDEEVYPWLRVEKIFIKNFISTGKKILGICLGSQLVSEALGVTVFRNPEKEIGWWTINTKADGAPEGIPDSFKTFHWHGETFELPPNGKWLFSSEGCECQGYVVGSTIAALQFHMEIEHGLMKSMITHGIDELHAATYVQSINEMEENAPIHLEKQKEYLYSFLDYFLKL